jgi:Cu/Ag efflux protein CusF
MTTVIATLTACGDSALEQAALPELPELPAQPGGAASAVEHVGHGTLNSINRAAGTVNISHEAVASAGWPAMTMDFKLADPAAAPEVAAGQRIEFDFTTDGGGTITRIAAE